MDRVGYGARDAIRRTSLRSIHETEQGYMVRVARFSALGHRRRDFSIHVHDLPDEWQDIDGLLGLSFLNELNYEIRSKEGRILVERAF